ncbi:PREDICTED: nicotinamide N-methyltransferase-like [Amphimedon queenslandica]|uniref:Methyltransferase domain-containing protein n=1 Tax=Amphimedon queenslandica TaxID=400682 RepID=A0A1X7TS66_AMPQE|nr:PREDICTED: nicotinamide N-methyltransferase-like [Amphimedon queenslandica]|eukprot:XP_011406965.1 PREDICTED: nicotinamide N-methyltransferase-like [Amphimedon queenslandica]
MENKYRDDFSPLQYLTEWYKDPSSPDDLFSHFILQNIHKFFKTLQHKDEVLDVLDIGCGPVISNVISTSRYARSIVLADYSSKSLSLLNQWLTKDPQLKFDWSTHFKYVVETLEGKGEREVREREELLRSKIKAIIPCDISQDPPLPASYSSPYDTVICSLVIDGAAETVPQYKEQLKRLHCLIKPGGHLLLVVGTTPSSIDYCYERYYMSKSQTGTEYCLLLLSPKYLSLLLKEVGFSIIDVQNHPNNRPSSNYTFISAKV